MRYDDAFGKTIAACGAIIMVVAALAFTFRLMVELDADWWVTYGTLFVVGAVFMFAGLYLRPDAHHA